MSHKLLCVPECGSAGCLSHSKGGCDTSIPKALLLRETSRVELPSAAVLLGRVRNTAVFERLLHGKCEQNSINARGQGTVRKGAMGTNR